MSCGLQFLGYINHLPIFHWIFLSELTVLTFLHILVKYPAPNITIHKLRPDIWMPHDATDMAQQNLGNTPNNQADFNDLINLYDAL